MDTYALQRTLRGRERNPINLRVWMPTAGKFDLDLGELLTCQGNEALSLFYREGNLGLTGAG